MTFPHMGIRIDDIPAEGVGGAIFAAGSAVIFAALALIARDAFRMEPLNAGSGDFPRLY